MGIFARFRRKPRLTQEAAADLLAGLIAQRSLACALAFGELTHEGPAPTDALTMEASHEFLFAMLHMVDRAAFTTLGQRRGPFVNRLVDRTIDGSIALGLTEDAPTDVKGALREALVTTFNERTLTYGQCSERPPTTDPSLKGTVSWEFGKIVAQAFGAPKDARYIVAAEVLLLAAMKELDAKATLSSIA